jgi:hypothetical protein
MAAMQQKCEDRFEIEGDQSCDRLAAAFRTAMIDHFRSHVPGTTINETTLLASDYLNRFHDLVSLIEAAPSAPSKATAKLLGWRPVSYEEHFSQSGFGDKNLEVAAYRGAPPTIRARFDAALEELQSEAVAIVANMASELKARNKRGLRERCAAAAERLRGLTDAADAIVTGQRLAG